MKNWLFVAGAICVALVIAVCGIKWVFSDTIEPRSKTVVTTKVVALPATSDEVDAEKLFSDMLSASAPSAEPIAAHEALANEEGFSFAEPIDITVTTKVAE